MVPLPGRELLILAPRDSEALLSEEAFAQEEFLPYWAELWPSAVALARVIARRPLTGRRVLELGCGLGLPALAAAAAGGRVWLRTGLPTPSRWPRRTPSATVCPSLSRRFRWDADPAALGAPWPLVLASDVLYEARNVEPLLALLPRVCAAAGEVWLADPGRAQPPRSSPRPVKAGASTHPARRPRARDRAPAAPALARGQRSRNALSRCSDRLASRSAAPATSTRPAIRPRKPPGLEYSLR